MALPPTQDAGVEPKDITEALEGSVEVLGFGGVRLRSLLGDVWPYIYIYIYGPYRAIPGALFTYTV